MYSVRNLEMTIRFLYNLGRLNDFIGQKCLKFIAEIRLRANVKLNFHKNEGLQ